MHNCSDPVDSVILRGYCLEKGFSASAGGGQGDGAMIRRRLFAYTVSMMWGVFAGYILMDRGMMLEGLLVILSGIFAVVVLAGNGEMGTGDLACLLIWAGIGLSLIAWYGARLEENYDSLSRTNSAEFISGRIVDAREYKNEDGQRDKLRLTVSDGRGRRFLLPVDVKGHPEILEKEPLLLVGRFVSVRGIWERADGARNPGMFDYGNYLKSRGIAAVAEPCEISLSGGHHAAYTRNGDLELFEKDMQDIIWGARRILLRKRIDFQNAFREDRLTREFIKGAVFGDKSGLDEETYDEFALNNTAHILTVSGLHLGIIYGALKSLTRSRRTLAVSIVIISMLFIYGEMTLWSPSTVRACIMVTVSAFATHVRRPFDLLSALSAAVMAMLAIQPYLILNTGFLMSGLAMMGMAFLSGPLEHFLGRGLGTAAGVQGAMTPFTAFSFNSMNPFSLFINIPMIFLASIFGPVAISSLCVMTVTGTCPSPARIALEGLSHMIVRSNSILATGAADFGIVSIPAWTLALLYLGMFYMSSEFATVRIIRKEWKRLLTVLCILAIPAGAAGYAAGSHFLQDDLIFLDVGQGDGIHIRTGAGNFLVDGGGSDRYDIGKDTLRPYLLKNGCSSIDISFLTHLHQDHALGAEELREVFPVRTVAVSERYGIGDLKNITGTGRVFRLSQGDRVGLGRDAWMEVVWPLDGTGNGMEGEDDVKASSNDNEMNMVMIFHINNKKVMITGDLLEEDETAMVEYYGQSDKLKCHVLKVGHHGSRSSSSEAFLEAVDPEIAVIQVGRNNLYGHPHREVLERLEKRKIKVYRTDVNGAVGIRLRPGGIAVHSMIGE